MADALSRSLEDSGEEEILYINKSEGIPSSFLALLASIYNLILELREETTNNPKLQSLMEKIEARKKSIMTTPSEKAYYCLKIEFI